MKNDNRSGLLTVIITFIQLIAVSMGITLIGMALLVNTPTSPKSPSQPTSTDLAKTQAQLVYKVLNKGAQGTGFALKYNGQVIIVTNKHVCRSDSKENEVEIRGKSLKVYDVYEQIIAIDSDSDLCLITSSVNKHLGFTLSNIAASPLDKVYTIGYGAGIKDIKSGRYLGHHYDVNVINMHTIGGQSGSPLFNEDGNIVGVIWGTVSSFYNYGLVVTLPQLKSFLERELGKLGEQ